MPFANYQTTADPHLLNPADSRTPGPLHGVSSSFDRSILGIPAAEDDEYTRGLTFFFDPSTGQPSVASTSEESDNPGEASPYEASPSSNNTGSRRVFTPKSVSDTSGGLHPLLLSSGSVGSSDGGWSDSGADHPHPPSVSARASAGSSQVASMPVPTQTPTLLPTSGKYGASTMSPEAVDPRIAQPFSPLEDMSDPRGIINIDQNDVNFLVGILSPEDQSRQGDSAQALDPMDLMDNQSSQGIAPQTGKHTGAVTARTPGASRRWQNPSRRRATTKDVTEKAKSTENQKLMRLLGSCLPCLVNHEKCEPGDICGNCLKALTSMKIQKTPCVRQHLSEAELFRKGALSFPDGLKVIEEWGANINEPLTLYNAGPANIFDSPESRPWLKVVCRRYRPTPGACCSKSWTKGTEKIDIHLPTYAMTEYQLRGAAKTMNDLIDAGYKKLVAKLANGQDEIISWTLAEAIRQAETCPTIKGALTLSILSRLASRSFNISGENNLKIPQEQDPECPYYKRIPIPPLLDAQIDSLLMDKMKNLRKTVLSGLRVMITDHGRKRWFKIYLTILVLLFNLESIYQNKCQQIKRYQQPTQQQRTMLESWKNAAQNLIDHFRAVCRGQIPLNIQWSKAEQDAAEVDDHSMEFINRLNDLTKSRAEDLREKSRASCDTPLVWISALFAP